MRVHHLNCASMRPFGGALVDGESGLFRRAQMVCHCLLVETSRGLVLVDTGFGLLDVADPIARLGRASLVGMHPALDVEETAARQIERLGFARADVRDIVVTHLDLDHAGGLADFPSARVHVFDLEHEAAMARRTQQERQRYRAVQWAHGPSWVKHGLATRADAAARGAIDGANWFGFEAVRALDDHGAATHSEAEILLVPLHGHTRGHCGVAVRERVDADIPGASNGGWLLHCGDAYFHRSEVHPNEPKLPWGIGVFEGLVQMDGDARLTNQRRLRELVATAGDRVRVFCAHDPIELARSQREGS